MRICAESFFALNALLDAGLLLCTARLCGARISGGRIAAASCFGGAYAVAALLQGLAFLRQCPVALCAAWVMGLIAFGAEVRLLRLVVMFMLAGCCLGGLAAVLVQRMPHGGAGGARVLLAAGGLMLAGGRLLFSACMQHTDAAFETLRLHLNGVSVRLRALVDTGNTLKDPLSNEPVLVANWDVAARLLPGVPLQEEDFSDAPALMQRLARQRPQLRLRLIPYRAVGISQGLLLAVRCEMERADGKRRAALVAFSPTGVSSAGEYEALTGGAA